MINYSLITDALCYYQALNYTLIDVPWTVSKEALEVTTPVGHDAENNRYLDKYLVGSAEQSFLQLIKDDKLPFGQYVGVTPCFRNDDADELHQKYFMKLELIHYLKRATIDDLTNMMDDAIRFFSLYVNVDVIETYDTRSGLSFDIEYNGIELGSYGFRHRGDISWVYGTGIAEPRFSIATPAHLRHK